MERRLVLVDDYVCVYGSENRRSLTRFRDLITIQDRYCIFIPWEELQKIPIVRRDYFKSYYRTTRYKRTEFDMRSRKKGRTGVGVCVIHAGHSISWLYRKT